MAAAACLQGERHGTEDARLATKAELVCSGSTTGTLDEGRGDHRGERREEALAFPLAAALDFPPTPLSTSAGTAAPDFAASRPGGELRGDGLCLMPSVALKREKEPRAPCCTEKTVALW